MYKIFVIIFISFKKIENNRRAREEEIKRRETERKKRHEEIAQDSKKPFFQLNQYDKHCNDNPTDKVTEITSKNNAIVENVKVIDENKEWNKFDGIDMNALDYEEQNSDKECDNTERERIKQSVEIIFDKVEKGNHSHKQGHRDRSDRQSRCIRRSRSISRSKKYRRNEKHYGTDHSGRYKRSRSRDRSDYYKSNRHDSRRESSKSRRYDKTKSSSDITRSLNENRKKNESQSPSKFERSITSATYLNTLVNKEQISSSSNLKEKDSLNIGKDIDIEELERIKEKTLVKLKIQEELKQLAAVKKVIEVVVSSVNATKNLQRTQDIDSGNNPTKNKRRRNSSPSTSSNSSQSSL